MNFLDISTKTDIDNMIFTQNFKDIIIENGLNIKVMGFLNFSIIFT